MELKKIYTKIIKAPLHAKIAVITMLITFCSIAIMSASSELYVFVSGSRINADEVNTNFTVLQSQITALTTRIDTLDENSESLEETIENLTSEIVPVGTILLWDYSFANTPDLPEYYVKCNGQVIDDSESVYYGYRTRNLNGASITLYVIWSGNRSTNIGPTAITALAVGDDVSVAGISTTITHISGNTVYIGSSVSGTYSTTFSNKGRFIRGSGTSGTGQLDAMQRITGYIHIATDSAGNNGVFSESKCDNPIDRPHRNKHSTLSVRFNSANSVSPNPAKTDEEETRPLNTSMVYIMRIK